MCAERTKKLNSAALRSAFSGCADFVIRAVLPGLAPGREAYVCWLDGLVDGAAVTEDVLRPLTERGRTPFPRSAERIMELMERGAVYSYAVKRRSSLEEACADLVNGCCAVVFDGPMAALTFETRSQTGRGVSEPTVEKSIKGAKDAFVETLRVNTSLVRRKLRSPSLKLAELTLGRESNTAVAVLYVEGVAKDATVQELLRRLRSIDTDGLLSAAEIEEALADSPKTPLPPAFAHGALGRLRHAAAERPRGRYRGRPAAGLPRPGLPAGLHARAGGQRVTLRRLLHAARPALGGAGALAAAAGGLCGRVHVPPGDAPPPSC